MWAMTAWTTPITARNNRSDHLGTFQGRSLGYHPPGWALMATDLHVRAIRQCSLLPRNTEPRRVIYLVLAGETLIEDHLTVGRFS